MYKFYIYSSGVPGLIIYNKTDKNIMYKFYKKKVIGIFSKPTCIDVYMALFFFIIAGMSYNVSAILGLCYCSCCSFIIINFFTKSL